ncbi:DUF3800 domain-containing protein [Francisella philomiragia]|uniref:DUF3800 domain-containing protein n=1 Tax=Francisella philomiragia TaxID=28110 RepID=UPI003512AB51
MKVEQIKVVNFYYTVVFYIFQGIKPQNKQKRSTFEKNTEPHIKDLTKEHIYSFIDTLSECLWSNNIHLSFAICPRDKIKRIHRVDKEFLILAYKSFLYSCNIFLSSKNENGMLISDIADNNQNNLFNKILNNLSNWRKPFNNPDNDIEKIMKSISRTDIYNDHIIENICFVDSKTSKLNQVADIYLYIIKKILEIKNSENRDNELNNILSNLNNSMLSLLATNTRFCIVERNKDKYEFVYEVDNLNRCFL